MPFKDKDYSLFKYLQTGQFMYITILMVESGKERK